MLINSHTATILCYQRVQWVRRLENLEQLDPYQNEMARLGGHDD